MSYIVIEIQKTTSIATLVTPFDNRNEAYSKYYQILTAAAVSQIPVHSAAILTEEGRTIECKTFNHESE